MITGFGTVQTVQRGAEYVGDPVDGAWWIDTGNNTVKYYIDGSWHVTATGGFSAAPSVTSLSVNGAAGELTTDEVTVTPSGGDEDYEFFWDWFSGGTGLTINDADADTTDVTGTPDADETLSGRLRCTVRDGDGLVTACLVDVSVVGDPEEP